MSVESGTMLMTPPVAPTATLPTATMLSICPARPPISKFNCGAVPLAPPMVSAVLVAVAPVWFRLKVLMELVASTMVKVEPGLSVREAPVPVLVPMLMLALGAPATLLAAKVAPEATVMAVAPRVLMEVIEGLLATTIVPELTVVAPV